MAADFRPEPFQPASMSDVELAAHNALATILRAEAEPGFPPKPLPETHNALVHDAPFVDWTHWRVPAAADVVARARVGVLTGMEGNEHLAVADMAVAHRSPAPGHRDAPPGQWVIEGRPGATAIRTGTAGSDAPMLKINTEMGFVPYKTQQTWQIPVDHAPAWCAARS